MADPNNPFAGPPPEADPNPFAAPAATAPHTVTPSAYDAAKARWRATVGDRLTPAREEGYDTGMQRRGHVQAGLTGFLSGTTGNLTDYPYAVGAGVEGVLTGKGFSDPYNASLERDAGEREALAEKYPVTSIGSEVTGAVAGAVGPSKLITGAKLLPSIGKGAMSLGRMLKAALVGGGVGAFQGAAGGEGVEGRAKGAATGAAWGAPFGAAGEAVVTGAGKVAQKYYGAATQPGPGVNPAARIAEADEFKIPLTRGTATGNVEQQAYEEAARHGARGPSAGYAVRSFDDQQARAIKQAQEGVSTKLGGAARGLEEGGDVVAGGLKAEAAATKSVADKAYKSAEGKHAWIGADDVSRLGEDVGAQLERAGFRLDTYGNFPGAQQAMTLLRRVAGFDRPPPGSVLGAEKPIAQSLEGVEAARQALLKVAPGNANDARALGAIRRSFDKWLDDAIDKRLFSGDLTAIDDLKEARSAWKRYKGLTAGEEGASKLVSKIINENLTGNEVANWMLGAAGARQAGNSARLASEVRKILGPGSQEWEALRQAAWTKIVNPTVGQGGPQALASSIKKFISGDGAPLARVLFSEEERNMMMRLAKGVGHTVVDPRATNPSKSSYGVARALGGGATMMSGGGAGYWWTGDPTFIAMAAAPLFKSTQGLSKGFAATRATPSALAGKIGQAARAGVTAGAAEVGEQGQ